MVTHNGNYVAVIPDFWYNENHCFYPAKRGELASSKRKQPDPTWLQYKCIFRREFGKQISYFYKNLLIHQFSFSESFNEAKKLISRAVDCSDMNTASEADENRYGKGKRVRKPRAVFSPTPQESTEEDVESSDNEQTTDNLPSVPRGMAENFSQSGKIIFVT